MGSHQVPFRRALAWVGVDFDGTVSKFQSGSAELGPPIPKMVERIRAWLAQGITVKIMTARASEPDPKFREMNRRAIRAWCLKHIGVELEVTATKDYGMIALWDDRAVHVVENTGLTDAEFKTEVEAGRVPEGAVHVRGL